MDIDPISGVAYTLHGPSQGEPLMIGLPLMASFEALFGPELAPVLDGYLSRLTDRYRVLLIDYPSIGGSRDMAPEALTAERVCADLFAVASAAGFDRFSYWGYSWGGGVGLQLASRGGDRLKALAIGGWPPIGGPYAAIAEAAVLKQHAPEPSSMKVLRSKAQYTQWIHYNRSVLAWDEAAALAAMTLPRLVFYGERGDLVEAGIPVPIASLIRDHAATLKAQGWHVLEVPGVGHEACMRPELFVPAVRAFFDRSLG